MATSSARLLFLSGFPVVVLERHEPLAVRRLVSFASAVQGGECVVESVIARAVDVPRALRDVRRPDRYVPVLVDEHASSLGRLGVDVLVDARMRKAPADPAPPGVWRVGLGPGFVAGADVDAVVETQRGPQLGRVVWAGPAEADTAVPSPVLGHTVDRVVRAPAGGIFRARVAIGAEVAKGALLGTVGGAPVVARIDGLVRGLVADGIALGEGEKLGDIDPRGPVVDPAAISEKARAVAAGVLEAVLLGLAVRGGR